MTNKIIAFLFSLFLFSCFRFTGEDIQSVQAELVRAELKNYKSKSFGNQPPWLEYHIVIRNRGKVSYVIMGNEGNVLIKSTKGEVVDSFNLSEHPIVVEPLESDTVRIVELFLEKKIDIDLLTWVEPDMEYVNQYRYNLDSLVRGGLNVSATGAVEILNAFKIAKSKDFTFSIE